MSLFTLLDWRIDDPNLDNMKYDYGRSLGNYLETERIVNPIKIIVFPYRRSDLSYAHLIARYEGLTNVYEIFGAIYSIYQQINPETGRKYIDDMGYHIWFDKLRYEVLLSLLGTPEISAVTVKLYLQTESKQTIFERGIGFHRT